MCGDGGKLERIVVPLWHEMLHVVLLLLPTWWFFCVIARLMTPLGVRRTFGKVQTSYVLAALTTAIVLVALGVTMLVAIPSFEAGLTCLTSGG
jgi:hypothetical protein